MVAFSRAFVFRSLLRSEYSTQSSTWAKKALKFHNNKHLGSHAHNMGYLDDKGHLTDLGRRLWLILAPDKDNNAV